jgi:hypothetical protein
MFLELSAALSDAVSLRACVLPAERTGFLLRFFFSRFAGSRLRPATRSLLADTSRVKHDRDHAAAALK